MIITVPSRPHSGTTGTYIILTFDHQHFKETCIHLNWHCQIYRRYAVYSYAGQHQKAQSLQLLDHCAQDFPFSNIIFFNGNFSQNFIWGSKCEQAHTCWFVRTKHQVSSHMHVAAPLSSYSAVLF